MSTKRRGIPGGPPRQSDAWNDAGSTRVRQDAASNPSRVDLRAARTAFEAERAQSGYSFPRLVGSEGVASQERSAFGGSYASLGFDGTGTSINKYGRMPIFKDTPLTLAILSTLRPLPERADIQSPANLRIIEPLLAATGAKIRLNIDTTGNYMPNQKWPGPAGGVATADHLQRTPDVLILSPLIVSHRKNYKKARREGRVILTGSAVTAFLSSNPNVRDRSTERSINAWKLLAALGYLDVPTFSTNLSDKEKTRLQRLVTDYHKKSRDAIRSHEGHTANTIGLNSSVLGGYQVGGYNARGSIARALNSDVYQKNYTLARDSDGKVIPRQSNRVPRNSAGERDPSGTCIGQGFGADTITSGKRRMTRHTRGPDAYKVARGSGVRCTVKPITELTKSRRYADAIEIRNRNLARNAQAKAYFDTYGAQDLVAVHQRAGDLYTGLAGLKVKTERKAAFQQAAAARKTAQQQADADRVARFIGAAPKKAEPSPQPVAFRRTGAPRRTGAGQ